MKTMKTIADTDCVWAVMGTAGDYSDRYEWIVAIYSTEEQAKSHADYATKYVQDCPYENRYEEQHEKYMQSSPFDADFSDGYATPRYFVARSLFVRHVDEYQEKTT